MARLRKRKGDELDEDYVDSQDVGRRKARVQDNPDAKRTVPQHNQSEDVDMATAEDDDDDDEGLTESQSMLALAKALERPTKRDKEIAQMRQNVQSNRAKLNKMIEAREAQMTNDQHTYVASMRAFVRDTIQPSTILEHIRTNERLASVYQTDSTRHPYLQYNDNMLAACGQVIRAMRNVSHVPTGTARQEASELLGTWQLEREQIEQQLKEGKRVALEEAEDLIGYFKERERKGQEMNKVQRVEDARERVSRTAEGSEITLGRILDDANEGILRFTRNLPVVGGQEEGEIANHRC